MASRTPLKSTFVLLAFFCAWSSADCLSRADAAEDGHSLPAQTLTAEQVSQRLSASAGFAVVLGDHESLDAALSSNRRLLLHVLVADQQQVPRFRARFQQIQGLGALIEYWPAAKRLPHAEQIANVVIAAEGGWGQRAEIERVLCPGGVVFYPVENGFVPWIKPKPEGSDEWTHQWHSASGGLVTRDVNVGVPEGIQWLSGPLFAMAGRKSSTQSLVSAGGVNFYVTQNVLENLPLVKDKPQYLVAKDGYNGLTLWQRPWTGPYVTGEGETNPRLVATSERLYVADERQLVALDAKTGQVVAQRPLRDDVEKILLTGGLLLIHSKNSLHAFDPELSDVSWELNDVRPLELVADDRSAYYLTRGRSADGQFQHDLVCVELSSGTVSWKQNTQPHVSAASVRINFVQDDLIALQAHGHLHIFSAKDGSHLWSRTTEARPGKDYADERYVGHFYSNGLVWMLDQNAPRELVGQNHWVGLEPTSGTVIRELTTSGEWPKTETPGKMGCQLLIASERYIMIPRQATFIDLETGEKQTFKFTRGGCGQGFIPANGLLYSHPHACGCFSEAVRGFMAMHSNAGSHRNGNSDTEDHRSADNAERLMKATDFTLKPVDVSPDAWPIYRGNPQRTSARSQEIYPSSGGNLTIRWTRQLANQADTNASEAWRLRAGQVLTSATVSGQHAFVADANLGQLFALNAATGEVNWTYAASGRIDSPPTVYRGLCLFGCHAGYVYALNADNGQLIWKYRAAPEERRIIAYGGIESAWPVAGSVLVLDGVALVAAGRAPDADGGIVVSALDPATGELRWSENVQHNLFHGVSDYLVTDAASRYAYLSNWQFDPRNGKNGPAPPKSTHLQGGKVGLLEASWTQYELASRKDMQTWQANELTGQLLTFNAELGASYDCEKGTVNVAGEQLLEIQGPRQVTGLSLAGNQLIIAGSNNRLDLAQGGFIEIWDITDKKLLVPTELDCQPVLDGVSTAYGNIFVCMQDGKVICLSTK